ncbi:MAG TPA: hypothetical protein VHE56_06830 [Mycobacteriales bacterium]|nr:hypothetical protein [Mycobacteriales bacterium]
MTQRLQTLRTNPRQLLTLAIVLLSLTGFLAYSTTWNTVAAAPRPMTKAVATSSAVHHTSKALRDPRRNVSASPDYLDFCATKGSNNKTCLSRALSAINNARAAEGIGPMILPTNYVHMSIPRQTFVVTNLERVDRGLRPFKGLTAKLNGNAHHAAATNSDPTLIGAVMALLGIRTYGSIWAGDFGPLASDYDWMYNDGYSSNGSVNLDCRTPSSSGCWGHRHVILGTYSSMRSLAAGVGTSKPVGSSIAEIFVGSTHAAFNYVYTWKQALAYGAAGHKVTASQATA